MVGFAADEIHRQGRTDLVYADIYHSANRYGTGKGDMVPICLPRSQMWSFHRRRLLLGEELMRLQGHTVSDTQLDTVTNAQMTDLAGNALLVWHNDMQLAMIYYLYNPFDMIGIKS